MILVKPAAGDTDWATEINQNWTDLESSLTFSSGRVPFSDGAALTSDPGLTYNSTNDALTVSGYLNVGTTTSATAQGDFSAGLTGAALLFFDQSIPAIYLYNSSGTIVNQLSGVAATATVFNEQGADIDFRIEGDTEQNLLLVDASADRVVIASGTTAGISGNAALSVHASQDASHKVAISLYPALAGSLPAYGIGMGPTATEGTVVYRAGTGNTGAFGHRWYVNDVRLMALTGDSVLLHYNTAAADVNKLSAVAGSETHFNEQGADIDFRVEGDNDPDLFFCDASTDHIGIGLSAPNVRLHLRTDGIGSDFIIGEASGSTGKQLIIGYVTGGDYSAIQSVHQGTAFTPIHLNKAGGGVIINEDGAAEGDFRVEGDTSINLLLVDTSADRVCVGGTGAGVERFSVFTGATNSADFRAVYLETAPTWTSSGTYYTIGLTNALGGNITISTGVTNSGYAMGFSNEMVRDNAGDLGTLALMYGERIQIGNYSSVGSTAVTTTAYGIDIQQFGMAGTVGSITGVIVQSGGGGGTVTTSIAFRASPIPSSAANSNTYAFLSDRGSVHCTAQVGQVFVWNEDGVDADFRVEGDTATHLLFCDASVDRVGIGTASPLGDLHIYGTGNGGDNHLRIEDRTALAAGVGGSINLLGIYTGTTSTDAADIKAIKDNATDGNYGFGLRFRTRVNGSGFSQGLFVSSTQSVVCNNAAIATNATDGFLYVPSCAGAPTGTPTAYTGRIPVVVDSTNNRLYFYSGGAWRNAGP